MRHQRFYCDMCNEGMYTCMNDFTKTPYAQIQCHPFVLISASAAQKFAHRGPLYRVYFERSSIL